MISLAENRTKENLLTIPAVTLSNIQYAFFTNEDGHSDAGYLIGGEKTRNVNLYSSEQLPEKGYDPADRVLANIQKCFQELSAGNHVKHKFFMTSYYANNGNSAPRIVSCDNLEDLFVLKAQASQNLYYEDVDKTNPNRLGLEPSMRSAISDSDISIIRADALIFRGIPEERIAVLGASGDAHPIMMFDDENKIACYISGAHAAIKQGVLEQSFDRMITLGANPSNIRLAIGPGLGLRSYEFGDTAVDYFSMQQEEHVEKVLTSVLDTDGKKKYLLNIKELVCAKLMGRLVSENIHDLELDTMGFDLYDEVPNEGGELFLKRKTTISFEELNETGLLIFGARRAMMQEARDLKKENKGAHNTVGRQAAGFTM